MKKVTWGVVGRATVMRRRLALVALLLAVPAAPAGASIPTAVTATPLIGAKTCSGGYVHARLSWGEKCLRAGEFCKVGNRDYARYGFTCPSSGHLRRR